SPIPIVTYVAPSGARAASAGTFILYASHVAAMAPGTNLGAASPVSIGELPNPSGNSGKTAQNSTESSTMLKKATNDAAAYIRSLADLRGRNADWAESAVRQAVSLPANAALKLQVIDLIANDVTDLLKQLDGRTVSVQGKPQILHVLSAQVEELQPDWR